MANIQVDKLLNQGISGAQLFNDSESFMIELSDDSEQIIGGIGACTKISVVNCVCTDLSISGVPTRTSPVWI
jgi:hypothetical protein